MEKMEVLRFSVSDQSWHHLHTSYCSRRGGARLRALLMEGGLEAGDDGRETKALTFQGEEGKAEMSCVNKKVSFYYRKKKKKQPHG